MSTYIKITGNTLKKTKGLNIHSKNTAMKKLTKKQLDVEIEKLRKELLENPEIDKQVKKLITESKELSINFPLAMHDILKFIKK